MSDTLTPARRAEMRRFVESAVADPSARLFVPPRLVLAVLDALDRAEAELAELRGQLDAFFASRDAEFQNRAR